MTVLKVSKSGKQFLVITDEGEVFACSIKLVQKLLYTPDNMPFVLLSRMPFGVSPDRFLSSPLWVPNKGILTATGKPADDLKVAADSFSNKGKTLVKEQQAFSDKVIDVDGQEPN
jgi:hypothetical protein